ncbi:rve domain-containing protein/RVT_3 domain-containing protein, partial [Cephalotus follicularis]
REGPPSENRSILVPRARTSPKNPSSPSDSIETRARVRAWSNREPPP